MWIPPKTRVWRYVYGIKLRDLGDDPTGADDMLRHLAVYHGHYYGAVIMGWMLERDEGIAFDLQQKLIEALETFMGYDYDEWWFPIDDGEGWQWFYLEDWPGFNPQLIGKWYLRIEDQNGDAVDEDWGRL
jgi:hypothetical protein